jgi:CSLREA domain-containing protein
VQDTWNFLGNPSDYHLRDYVGTETLVFPSSSRPDDFIVEPQYLGFLNDIENPLRLTILPRTVYTVTSTADTPDANPGDGVCADANGVCTLRAAIQEANASVNSISGPDAIEFNIPGSGPQTIQPLSALPAITDAVVIDATTQPGYAGTPLIELDGSLAGAGVSGLRFETGGNTVKGLAINRFAVNGIMLDTGGGSIIQGNFLGTNAAGTAAAPNGTSGIEIRTAGNTIGGAGAGEGNLISGNRFGVAITGAGATGNSIQGNRIGTTADGNSALANIRFGVTVSHTTGTTVGGTAPGSGNVLSGNGLYGVMVTGAGATNTAIQGNLAGLNASGTAAVPNGAYGIAIFSPETMIGGAGACNVASGNLLSGILVYTATGATIQGNLIGTDSTGGLAVPNHGHGLLMLATNSLVGGSAPGEGNGIGWNTGNGIYVTGTDSNQNAIRRNSIFRNGLLGIDLAPWGPTANDPDDADTGPNRLQNFPVMTAAVLSAGMLSITYSVPSSTANSAYPLAVEFFLADANNQEGQTYLGTHSYPTPGVVTVTFQECCIPAGARLVTTATAANGNTWEFSASIVVTSPLFAPAISEGEADPAATLDPAATRLLWHAGAEWQMLALDASHLTGLRSQPFRHAESADRSPRPALLDRIMLDRIMSDTGVASDAWRLLEKSAIKKQKSKIDVDFLSAVLDEMGDVFGFAE